MDGRGPKLAKTEKRNRVPDSEKITLNLGHVDLGRMDLLVREGFYANRTDVMRTAIRALLDRHDECRSQDRWRASDLDLGIRHFGRAELEAARDAGRPLADPRARPRHHSPPTSIPISRAPPSRASRCSARCRPRRASRRRSVTAWCDQADPLPSNEKSDTMTIMLDDEGRPAPDQGRSPRRGDGAAARSASRRRRRADRKSRRRGCPRHSTSRPRRRPVPRGPCRPSPKPDALRWPGRFEWRTITVGLG